MSEPFLGQIAIFGFNFPPRGWALCDGQILPINQNQSLFSILGTTYGGDGRTSFALPDLRGRLPMEFGSGKNLGLKAGSEGVSLNQNEMGSHSHSVSGSNNTASAGAAGKVLGTGSAGGRGSIQPYRQPANTNNLQPLEAATIGLGGSGAAHNNMQPSLVLSFCIALQGLFPSRN
jgi:microcystin-dependent protein